MLQSTMSSSAFTPLSFTADRSALPSGASALPQATRTRTSLHEEFAAHRLLQQISELPANWDSCGAAPIQRNTAINAHCALNLLLLDAPVPDITPNTNGTVSFEWETQHGHAHLEVGLTRFSFYVKLFNGPTIPLGGDAAALTPALGSVISALLFPVAGAGLTAITPTRK
jgi:hypothetical protein